MFASQNRFKCSLNLDVESVIVVVESVKQKTQTTPTIFQMILFYRGSSMDLEVIKEAMERAITLSRKLD